EAPAAASNDGVQTLLSARRGVFVTVTVGGELNGCVGAVETDEPLAVSVPRLARQAAFADPRLPALRAVEVPDAAITVSVLGPLEPMDADTAEQVARLLRLGVDGLLLRSGLRQALTFRTNCSAAARTSSPVAGSAPRRVTMLRHMSPLSRGREEHAAGGGEVVLGCSAGRIRHLVPVPPGPFVDSPGVGRDGR